jgi:hypothetical protein
MSQESREYIRHARHSIAATIENLADATSYAKQAGDGKMAERIDRLTKDASSIVQEIDDKSFSQKG